MVVVYTIVETGSRFLDAVIIPEPCSRKVRSKSRGAIFDAVLPDSNRRLFMKIDPRTARAFGDNKGVVG